MSAQADAGKAVTCSIAPMLSVRHGAGGRVLQVGLRRERGLPSGSPDGAVVSRLSVDGAEFWVADESPEHSNLSPESLGGGTVRMILTVPDPDAMFAKALAAGARPVVAVKEDYGWRLGRVVDPFGHLAFNGLGKNLPGSLPQYVRQQVSFRDWNNSR